MTRRDLRGAPRFAFGRRAWCEHRQFTLYPTIVDLSRTGLFLQTTTPLAVGERVAVRVLGTPEIVVEVVVMWSRRRGSAAGLGCEIVGFLEGENAYASLLAQLGADAHERAAAEEASGSWRVGSR